MHTMTASNLKYLDNVMIKIDWDENDDLKGVSEIDVENNFELGIQSMQELLKTVEPNDWMTFANGFTSRQMRILEMKAPNPAHYISEKITWDLDTLELKNRINLYIPAKIQWHLFEKLFMGQYSIAIGEPKIDYTSEFIPPKNAPNVPKDTNPNTDGSKKSVNGQLLTAEARVEITLHLANNQVRTYAGIGVSTAQIPLEDINNVKVWASNQMIVKKGAVTSAKANAIASIGEVFRIAHEDGSKFHQQLEECVTEFIRSAKTQSNIHQFNLTDKVLAPKRPSEVVSTTNVEEISEDLEIDVAIENTSASDHSTMETDAKKIAAPTRRGIIKLPASTSQTKSEESSEEIEIDEQSIEALAAQEISGAPSDISVEQANETDNSSSNIEESEPIEPTTAKPYVKQERTTPEKDHIPEFELDENTVLDLAKEIEDANLSVQSPPESFDNTIIDINGKSGRAVLGELLELFSKAKAFEQISHIIKNNEEAVTKLTTMQTKKFKKEIEKYRKNLS